MSSSYDIKIVFEAIPKLLSYLPMTLLLTAMPLFLGLALGAVIMAMREGKNKILRAFAQFYIFTMRATPPLIQIFLIYYGLPVILLQFGININGWSKVVFAILSLTFNSAAYLAEILRSSFAAVHKGQFAAASSIGMTTFQTYVRIIIPQAFKVFLPGF
jgi:L-cystine transport system permease protein